mmetsp:Transcript_8465/g.16854  ORF Transcript_8465/g.16854 Transcript_8465/m.16854 type:complete len:398 (-) Transcript_8465:744-1937(-)
MRWRDLTSPFSVSSSFCSSAFSLSSALIVACSSLSRCSRSSAFSAASRSCPCSRSRRSWMMMFSRSSCSSLGSPLAPLSTSRSVRWLISPCSDAIVACASRISASSGVRSSLGLLFSGEERALALARRFSRLSICSSFLSSAASLPLTAASAMTRRCSASDARCSTAFLSSSWSRKSCSSRALSLISSLRSRRSIACWDSFSVICFTASAFDTPSSWRCCISTRRRPFSSSMPLMTAILRLSDTCSSSFLVCSLEITEFVWLSTCWRCLSFSTSSSTLAVSDATYFASSASSCSPSSLARVALASSVVSSSLAVRSSASTAFSFSLSAAISSFSALCRPISPRMLFSTPFTWFTTDFCSSAACRALSLWEMRFFSRAHTASMSCVSFSFAACSFPSS